jgi:hypothetical protein
MGIWVPWLADAARMTGYPVVEVGGWRGRGHGPMRVVEVVVAHHTADGPTGDYPSLRIVRDGRAGLAGPLSQLGLGRHGTIFVIAAGQSWHAGASSWAGFWDLNDEAIGIEAESVGTRDDWTDAQRDAYPRLCAALLHFMRRSSGRLGAHREVCRPAGRKIDPAYWHMDGMRDQVGAYLANPPSINRHWRPEEDMPLSNEDVSKVAQAVWLDPSTDVIPVGNQPDGYLRPPWALMRLDHALIRVEERQDALEGKLDAILAKLDEGGGEGEAPLA